jgi:phage FluMu protein Com
MGVYISFSREEKELYYWILTKTEKCKKYRRGTSEFIKDLLWAMYLAEKSSPEMKRLYVLKTIIELTRCRFCGGRVEFRELEGDKLRFYCPRCAVLDAKIIKTPDEAVLDI